MLMAGKVDVGWGQGCTELITNPGFFLSDPNVTDGNDVFRWDKVIPWKCVSNDPNYFALKNNECENNSTNPILASLPKFGINFNSFAPQSSDLNYNARIIQNLATPLMDDPYISYNLKYRVAAELSNCSLGASNARTIEFRLGNSVPLVTGCTNITQSTLNNMLMLHTSPVTSNTYVENSFNFGSSILNNNYSQLMISGLFNSGLNSRSHFFLENVSLTCKNLGLSDILTTGECAILQFTAKNDSPYNFVSYKWNFNDPNSWDKNLSDSANPTHHFTAPGIYNVCVDIIDENDCCNTLCKNIVVPPNNSSCSNLHCAIRVGTSASSVTTMSSLILSGQIDVIPGFFGTKQVYNYDFQVKGKLIVDDYITFVGTKWFMDSGSEIEVQLGFTTFVTSTFEACNNMWRGITIGANTIYNAFSDCKIKDAKVAITAKDKSIVGVYNCEFDRNLICVDFEGGAYTQSFFNNKFYCTTDLKAMYPGFELAQLYDTRTYCGVRALNNAVRLKLNGLSGYRNIYDGLRNGIVAHSTSIECKYSDFKNSVSSTILPAGYGIYSTNINTAFNFNVSNCTFDNVLEGIYLQGLEGGTTSVGTLAISNNSFTNIVTSGPDGYGGIAVYMFNLFGGTYDISSNTFNNVGSFLSGARVTNHSGFVISNTNFSAPNNTFVSGGISLSSITSSGPHTMLVDNKLKGSISNGYAMSLSRGKYGVMNNILNGSYSSSNQTIIRSAINLTNSPNSEIRQNTINITGAQSTSKCAGIYMQTSSNVLYCCNNITGGARGTQFKGSNSMTRYKQNTMNDAAQYGLYLEGSTVIDPQYEEIGGMTHTYGNIWKGNLAAKHEGIFTSSIFRVDEGDESMLSSGQKYLPMANPTLWFKNDSYITPSLCNTSTDCGEDVFDGIGPWICGVPNLLMMLEQGIDSIATVPAYEDQAIWSHQLFTYGYMEHNPSVATVSTTLSNFYNNPPAVVYQAHQIEKKIDEVFKLSPSLQASYDAANSSLNSLIGQYELLVSTLDSSNVNTLQPTLFSLNAQIVVERNNITTILSTGHGASMTKLNQIRSMINAMPMTYAFIAEYKAIKHAWIDYLQYGKTYALATHTSTINSIANSCIGIYGSAVTDAQVLQGLLGLTVTNLDDCIAPRTKQIISEHLEVTIKPNPSNGIWEVILDVDHSKSDKINIKSIDGRMVYSQKVNNAEGEIITIDGMSWDNGVYIMDITDRDGQVLSTNKLIKLK